MSAIFFGTINGSVASAEDENTDSEPDYSSNVEISIDENNYSGGNILHNQVISSEESHQTLNVSNITTSAGEINAGWSYMGTSYNILNIRNVNAPNAFFHGGYTYGKNTNAEWNIINFHSGIAGYIHGAHANKGDATNNTVNFFDGKVINMIGTGYSDSGNACYNILNISGGTFKNTKEDEKINIYGGWAPGGKAENNEINIYGNPILVDAILIAGKGASDSDVSNNTLKIHTKNLTVYDIQGFENLKFYLPANTVANDTILIVTNPSQQISKNIYVFKDKNSTFNDNDKITLITTESPEGLNLGDIQNNPDNLKITEVKEDNIVKGLVINAKDITRITPEDEEEQNKMNPSIRGGGEHIGSTIFNEPVADSVSLLDSGTDRLLDWLPPEGLDYMNSSPTAGFDPFVGIGGSKLEIDTGNGTKLKTKSGGINFGMTRYLKNRHGMFIIAPVVDYGQDSYDSTLPDENQTKGSGNSKYFTAGLIARQVSVNGMYYEASVRYGRLKTDFTSNNFLVNGQPATASYAASTPCYSGHVRIGWRNHISPKNILDVYGVYSMNRINGFTTKVSTGEDYSFGSVNSGRMRIGARFTRELKERESVYSNLAYIHEFTGETVGEYMGMTTPRSSLKGSAGLIELGWQIKPAKNSVAMLDTSISLWLGDRKGFTFATKLKKDF